MAQDNIAITPGSSVSSCQQAASPAPSEGTLGGRKVKTYYPEFGEKRAKTKDKPWIDTLKKVAIVAAVIAVAAAIGFLVASLVGMAIGIAIGGAVVGTVFAVKAIYDHVNAKRFHCELSHDGGHSAHLPPNKPKLGAYYEAAVRLTKTADEGLAWKKALIASAQESIEISANFAGGSDFRKVLELIDDKMANNERIKTHLLLSSDLLEPEDKDALSRMQDKYGARLQLLVTERYYNFGFESYSQENHVKMLVVDGKYFVSGGTSIHPRLAREGHDPEQEKPALSAFALEPATRDTDIVGESAHVAAVLRDQFFNLYRIWEIRTYREERPSRYFPLQHPAGHCQRFSEEEGIAKDVRMKVIVSGPEHRGNNPIVRQYTKRILKAKQNIRLANMMFHPPKTIRKALQKAKEKNPKLERIAHLNGTDGSVSLGRLPQKLVGRGNYHLVDKVFEYQAPNQIYHKKVALFDDTHMLIGSYNFGNKSTHYDHEIAFVIKDAKIAGECKQALHVDASRSEEVDHKSISQSTIAKMVSATVAFFMQNFV